MKYLLILVILASCYGSRKAEKQVDKAIDNFPVQTAEQLRDRWPCVPTATVTDSTAYKQYLEDLRAIEELYASAVPDPVLDTFVESWEDSTKINYLKGQNKAFLATLAKKDRYISDLLRTCRDKPPIHDTIKIEDKASTFICESENTALNKKVADQDRKIERRGKWNLWLIIAVCVLALLNYIQFRKR